MRAPLFVFVALAAVSGCGSNETSTPGPASGAEVVTEPATEREAEPATEAAAEPATEPATEAEPEPEPDSAVAPHEVVILSVHDDPLLRSEQRLLDVIEERMQMRRIDAIEREAAEAEAGWARAFFAGEGERPAALPSSLSGASVVVVLRFPPNRELDRGQRATRGLGGVLAFRAGASEPFFEARIDDDSAWRVPDEQVWPWLISLVRAEVAS